MAEFALRLQFAFSGVPNYNDLTEALIASPFSRTIPNFNYNATAGNNLWSNSIGGLQVLTTNYNNIALTLNFTSGSPTAVGGYFFNTNTLVIINDLITVAINPGAVQQSVVTNSSTNFFGWIDDSGTPFTSLVIQPAGPYMYAAVDDLILGQAASTVPGPLPLMGAVTAFGFSRRLRSRIAAGRPRV